MLCLLGNLEQRSWSRTVQLLQYYYPRMILEIIQPTVQHSTTLSNYTIYPLTPTYPLCQLTQKATLCSLPLPLCVIRDRVLRRGEGLLVFWMPRVDFFVSAG